MALSQEHYVIAYLIKPLASATFFMKRNNANSALYFLTLLNMNVNLIVVLIIIARFIGVHVLSLSNAYKRHKQYKNEH